MVINTWDQLVAAGGGVAVSYRAAHDRACVPARWVVFRVDANGHGVKTDPGAHWTDNGCKTFSCHSRETKKMAEAAALAWATEHYGVTAWDKNRMRDWVPADIEARFPIPKRERAK